MNIISGDFIRRLGISSIMLFLCALLNAETFSDSSETVPVTKSPRKAMILSSLCPGVGQWYNEKKLKSVVVLGGEAALILNSYYYNQRVIQSITEEERNFYENYRSLFIWYAVGFYFLNILDAYVDAHLFHFDVSPDIGSTDIGLYQCSLQLSFSFPVHFSGEKQ